VAYNWLSEQGYAWSSPEDLEDLEGVPGQGTSNPASIFDAHAFAFVNGKYYDPSYGKIYTSLAAIQSDAIYGFFRHVEYGGNTYGFETRLNTLVSIDIKEKSSDDY
jgi:hypothetical protein